MAHGYLSPVGAGTFRRQWVLVAAGFVLGLLVGCGLAVSYT